MKDVDLLYIRNRLDNVVEALRGLEGFTTAHFDEVVHSTGKILGPIIYQADSVLQDVIQLYERSEETPSTDVTLLEFPKRD